MGRKAMRVLALPVLCALLLPAAGCGGGGKSSSAGGSAAATKSKSSATKSKSSESGSGGSAKDCKEFAQAANDVGTQFAAAITGSGGEADVQKAAKLFDQVASKAPNEIRDDFQTINDAFQKLAEALEGVDLSGNKTPDQATLQKIQKASSEIDQKKLSEASAHITAWAQKNCKA
jgi:cell fate (sporulation/competence/biofilm development) regulator YlbF (YheA/YmcA/DUF963 family)